MSDDYRPPQAAAAGDAPSALPFTWRDVDDLRGEARALRGMGWHGTEWMDDLAGRIERLLPPRKPER